MKIQHVKISNILGVQALEFTPAAGLTAITGQNGQGKTSVLEAMRSVLGKGHDATLLRKGATEGEVVLVLEDGIELRERVTAAKTTRDVIKDGKKIAKPADTLASLTDALSVNPVDFLTATKKDRVKVLLESMPLVADAARLSQITGIPVEPSQSHALNVIEFIRKQVYDDRTGTNRAVAEKAATINQLELALPEAPGGVEGSEEELQAKVKAADDAKNAELTRVADKLGGIQRQHSEACTALRAEAQAKIDAIKAELEQALASKESALREIEGKAQAQREKTIQRHAEAVNPLNQALAVIRVNRDNAARRAQSLAIIEQMKEDLTGLEQDAAKQTQALKDLEAYKSELLSSLPISGLEVIDGEVFRDGIPFDRLNTAQQVRIAIEIAALRAGDLAVCCVDRLECLDSESFEELAAQAEEMGLQLFVTRVSDEEFGVKAV